MWVRADSKEKNGRLFKGYASFFTLQDGRGMEGCKCRLKNVQKWPVVYSQAFAPVIVSSFRRGAVRPTN